MGFDVSILIMRVLRSAGGRMGHFTEANKFPTIVYALESSDNIYTDESPFMTSQAKYPRLLWTVTVHFSNRRANDSNTENEQFLIATQNLTPCQF